MKERQEKKEIEEYEAALQSADNWVVVDDEHRNTVTIKPLGIQLSVYLSSGAELAKVRKRHILNRIVELVKTHGI